MFCLPVEALAQAGDCKSCVWIRVHPWIKRIMKIKLEEDPKLLMWYDQAVTRMGGE